MAKTKAKNICVIGASLGGLVAAAKLRDLGYEVTIYEKGKSVGGLFGKAQTPFGLHELGMHVVYVEKPQYDILCQIMGSDVFNVLRGPAVDIGGSVNFNINSFNSVYPNLLEHKQQKKILKEVRNRPKSTSPTEHALAESCRRFGDVAGVDIVAPILEKLWQQPADRLTPSALHCFFDLRRIVLCHKEEADALKQEPALDEVIANPIQSQPAGEVYGGRLGLVFKSDIQNLTQRVVSWANDREIALEFGTEISMSEGQLLIEEDAVSDLFDACIIAIPTNGIAQFEPNDIDQVELSIAYFQLGSKIDEEFPAYYVLCHDKKLASSRIVNYSAYNPERMQDELSILSVEFIHEVGQSPDISVIADDLQTTFPSLSVVQSHKLERSMKICSPTLKNRAAFDAAQSEIRQSFGQKPVYFTGMRTDIGQFFSHQTIGSAYESALDCHERLH